MAIINLSLKLAMLTAGLCICASALPARAQDVKAMPVTVVQEEKLPVLGNAPVVIELFSSQACAFCPKADRLFADLLQQENVIGIACHVDYFDVKSGSLAQPFCTERQSWYMEKLVAGPNYTPQLVINGTTDAIGYKLDIVVKALQAAARSDVVPLEIRPTTARGTYQVILPEALRGKTEGYKIWLAVYDKPHELTIADGRNRGQKAIYPHIVSQLGGTEKLGADIFITPPLTDGHAGFVVILQDMRSGRIAAAADIKKS